MYKGSCTYLRKPFVINNADLDGDAEVIVSLFQHLRSRTKYSLIHHIVHTRTVYHYPACGGCLRFDHFPWNSTHRHPGLGIPALSSMQEPCILSMLWDLKNRCHILS